jgi:hypothetical protein
MDCSSINLIDLQFFSNPLAMQKMNRNIINKKINTEEIQFYKIRIFNMAKEILQGKEPDQKLKHIFNNFSHECIQYFKFIDKADSIQKDYKKNINETKEKKEMKDVSGADFIMMKKKNVKIPKITDFIKIKTTIKKKTYFPKEHDINLSDPKYKTKGIKKNVKK